MICSLSLLQGSLKCSDSPFPLLEIQSASEKQFWFYKTIVYRTSETIPRGHLKMNHQRSDICIRRSAHSWGPGMSGWQANDLALQETRAGGDG